MGSMGSVRIGAMAFIRDFSYARVTKATDVPEHIDVSSVQNVRIRTISDVAD